MSEQQNYPKVPFILWNTQTSQWDNWEGHISEMDEETAFSYVPAKLHAQEKFRERCKRGIKPGIAMIMTLSEYA